MLAAAGDTPLAGFQAGRVAQNDGEALPTMRPWTIRMRRKVEEPLPQELVCRLQRTRTANIEVSAADRRHLCSLALYSTCSMQTVYMCETESYTHQHAAWLIAVDTDCDEQPLAAASCRGSDQIRTRNIPARMLRAEG